MNRQQGGWWVVIGGVLLVLGFVSWASADVLNMGGTRNPATGQWTGLASLETVPVGNAGNAADTTGYGAVSYTYNIGTYEVTAGQYTEFLNKVAGVDANGLYSTGMWSDSWGCKIERYTGSGTSQSPYQYRVAADYANRPVDYVSYWDSCRFANWLHNGQPSGAQDAATTEDGAYTLTLQGIAYNTISRNGNSKWAVTSEDEWYKAAYYKGGTTNAGYWLYPTSSDTAPGQDMSDASGNNANYYTAPYVSPIDSGKYATLVGEFQNSDSPYGTFDQGGNVWEWNESIISGSNRGLRGGSFCVDQSSNRSYYGFSPGRASDLGLRVSQVPEPAAMALFALGGLLIARCRRV